VPIITPVVEILLKEEELCAAITNVKEIELLFGVMEE
jgi:hypothetical protein